MAPSTISTTRRLDRPPVSRRGFSTRRAGFSLLEVLSAMTISSVVMGAVMSTFLLLGRSGANAASYMTMDTHSRRALNIFAQDVRAANGATWISSTSVTVLIPNPATNTIKPVTYSWDNDATSVTYRCLYRVLGDASVTSPKEILARNVSSCEFSGFNRLNAVTTRGFDAKRIHVALTLRSSSETVVNATDQVAGSFVLRNQRSL